MPKPPNMRRASQGPKSASSGFVSVPGGKLFYEEQGAGPAVILIHGGIRITSYNVCYTKLLRANDVHGFMVPVGRRAAWPHDGTFRYDYVITNLASWRNVVWLVVPVGLESYNFV